MLNRSAAQIGYTAAFCEWLQASHTQEPPSPAAKSRTLYLIPAFEEPEQAEEVVEDLFEEIFRRELQTCSPMKACSRTRRTMTFLAAGSPSRVSHSLRTWAEAISARKNDYAEAVNSPPAPVRLA